jgi:recombination protein RecA
MNPALAALKSAVKTPSLPVAISATQVIENKNLAVQSTTSKADKLKQLKAVEAALNKQFNTSNSLVRLKEHVGVPMPSIPTGISTLDLDVIGVGGFPRGRIIELFGPESGGKTTLALETVAEEQRTGALCAYVDAEHALDPNYMEALGVNVDELVISQPDSGEQALETVEALVESGAVTLIVVDSVAALVPQAELDGDMGDSHMGLQARMMSQAMRKLRGKCSMHGVTVIFINQIREKIGVMFGSPETTPGGRALKFYASVRIDVRRVGQDGNITSGDVTIGHKMKLRAVKNKVGAPARSTEVNLIYGKGIDRRTDFINFAKDVGAIEQAGAWFKFEGENIGQGFLKAIDTIKDNPELEAKIRVQVNLILNDRRQAVFAAQK